MTDDELTEAEQAALAKLPPITPFPASDRFLTSMEQYWAAHPKPAKPRPVKKPPLPKPGNVRPKSTTTVVADRSIGNGKKRTSAPAVGAGFRATLDMWPIALNAYRLTIN